MKGRREKIKLSIRIPMDMLVKIRIIAEINNRSLNEEIVFPIDEDFKNTRKM